LSDRSRHTFALVPRRRFLGTHGGGRRSARRGEGDTVAGSRAYRPGDHMSAINWAATARLSAARGTDEFIVDDYFADQMPRVALAVDRRRAMALYPPPLPWLDKAAAATTVAEIVAASAAAARARLLAVTPAGVGPGRATAAAAEPDEGDDALRRSLRALLRRRNLLPLGSFLFVVSDFLVPVEPELWASLVRAGWDVTPVVVQDPTWEQSFPPVAGVTVPFVSAADGAPRDVWLTPRAARRLRREHEQRLASLLQRFQALRLDPVLVDTADAADIAGRFNGWAERRRRLRGRAA
jgi:uncharacterized protein (DUF58 family)